MAKVKGNVITRHIGDLRGFSTDSIFIRPANVADRAINIQKASDGTLELRRGYQCQIAAIGGMGIGTFDDPVIDQVHTVTLGMDGYLYNKEYKQIYLYYNGQVTGPITAISQANPAKVTSNGHGLATGAILILRDIGGMENLNNNTYTITVVDFNNFTLNGVNSTAFPAYTTGGYWSISFADKRYLTFSIFTDPRFLETNPGWSVQAWSITPWGAPSGESITCNIAVNRAAQIQGATSTPTNTMPVAYGHELVALDIIQFYTADGAFNQRTVVSVTTTSITFDGYPAVLVNGNYVSQFFDIPFRKGFDVVSPYLISTFIDTITNPTTGIYGLQVSINGLSNLPAAFIQIVEPIIIDDNLPFTLPYWYWSQINYTSVNGSNVNAPPFPGSANPLYQNSPDFENASMEAFDDVIFVANGWDYPQKYDGQTVYRAGMPQGIRPPLASDNTSYISEPFSTGNIYQYAITYEQVDNRGHIVEGEISQILEYTVQAATAAINITVNNLISTLGANWNTNSGTAVGGQATVYGPDSNGYYYDLVTMNSGYTLKIGDSAYYADLTCAVVSAIANNVSTIPVVAGHGVLAGDTIYFIDSSGNEHQRLVNSVTATSITIAGSVVSVKVSSTLYSSILDYLTSIVFGDVAIVNGNQSNTNIITVKVGHSILIGDVVDFLDVFNRPQRRNVTNTSSVTITIDGIPVDVNNLVLIASENQNAGYINLQRLNSSGATLGTNAPISNNLRINIYRTLQGQSFLNNANLYLVGAIPNLGMGSGTQVYVDGLADTELTFLFENPAEAPNPPPISKYLKAFGNQLFYAGGERGNAENSDNVFFSEGLFPEAVSLAANFFSVPNADDEITGIGISGSTLVTTKTKSLWGATGDFLSGNIEVLQIASGTNIGCIAHASIASVGSLMYFLHTNGVYALTENQIFPTDAFGNPIPISKPIDTIFRVTPFVPSYRYVFKRAVAINYPKDNRYLLFLPCENAQSTIRVANVNSAIMAYDYENKDWFQWTNMNAAGGMVIINDDLFFQERRFSGINGNTANLYKEHRFYRLVDHADHAGPQRAEWRSSWEDLGQPEVRKKFSKCVLLLDRVSELFQYNNPMMNFSSYLNRIPNLQNTIATITQTDNIRNASWSYSGWGWNFWSGYQDSFVTINLRQGTVAKSIQVGFTIQGINMDIRLAGFQLEVAPEFRNTVVR